MRVWLALALLLLAPAAAASIGSEPLSVIQTDHEVALRLVLSFEIDRKLLITSAVLWDDTEHFYDLAAKPSGIQMGTSGSCALGTFVAAESRQLLALRFRAPDAHPPFTLVLEFQSPDSHEQSGCRTTVLTVEGFEP